MKLYMYRLVMPLALLLMVGCSKENEEQLAPIENKNEIRISKITKQIGSESNLSDGEAVVYYSFDVEKEQDHVSGIKIINAPIKESNGVVGYKDLYFYDDGTNGDKVAGDFTYTGSYIFKNITADQSAVINKGGTAQRMGVEINCALQISSVGQSGACGTCGGTSAFGGSTWFCVGICNCTGITFTF